jgi:uncharacterized repeat protein (TIGR01451 family)
VTKVTLKRKATQAASTAMRDRSPARGGARFRGPVAAAAIVAASWSCLDASSVDLLQIEGVATVMGQAYVDLDNDGALSAGDGVLADADVVLMASFRGGVVDVATTDSLGAFTLSDVPVGSYVLVIDTTALGDSLVTAGAGAQLTLLAGDMTVLELGATFEALALEDALAAPVGSRIFTSGIALNTRVNSDPNGQVHFEGETAFLRALNVERGTLNPGDSVRLLGRVVVDNGRPALDNVTPRILVPSAQAVVPIEMSTATATTADGGSLDAALARIRRAEITDTSTVDGDFRFWADDGSDSVEVVIREFLVPSVNTSTFRPDTIIRIEEATGLLSPYDDGSGAIRWRFFPRQQSDVVLQTKVADIAVTTAFDTAQASQGDTVEISVVAANNGPLDATLLQVRDSIPTGATFVSSTETTGTYASGTGIWDIGSLAAGAADTLRIRVEITATAPATVTNIAESLGLTFEDDPPGNNTAQAALPIS